MTTSVAQASFLPHFTQPGAFPFLSLRGAQRRGNPAGIATFPGNRLDCHVGTSSHLAMTTSVARASTSNDNKRGAGVHFHDNERGAGVLSSPTFAPWRLSQFVIARSEATRQSSRHRYVPGQPTGLPRRDFVPPRNDNERGAGVHFHDDKRGVCGLFRDNERGASILFRDDEGRAGILSSPTSAPWRLRGKPISSNNSNLF
jgi:hypothetical protein